MKKLKPDYVFFLLSFLLMTFQSASGQDALQGVWKITKVTYNSPDTSWTSNNPQPGLFIFSGNYYSTTFVNADKARKPFNEQTTDKEMLEAFFGFISNTGTYEVNGKILTVRPIVALQPSVMADNISWDYTLDLSAESMTLGLKAAWVPAGAEMTYLLIKVG